LCIHHHDVSPDEDYASLLNLAKDVHCQDEESRTEQCERYSMRRDRRNRMEGFTGRITYTGELAPFLPYLLLRQWLHVGKWTSFGMGQYRLTA